MRVEKIESQVPPARIRAANGQPLNPQGDFVLYWMIANRRLQWNFSLQRAVDYSRALDKPLLVFEALRAGYQWNCHRIHAYVIQGMADNEVQAQAIGLSYYPYLEPAAGEGDGALARLAQASCVVVSDDFPCFFLPRMVRSAAKQIPVQFELIDSNGLWPMHATDQVFSRAYDFRRFLQKNLPPHLDYLPQADPLAELKKRDPVKLPPEFVERWPRADVQKLSRQLDGLHEFPIDATVGPIAERGGARAAEKQLQEFLANRLDLYGEQRNEPETQAASELSGYLHFGHLSAHQIFSTLMKSNDWTVNLLPAKATGSSSGWWGVPATVESFLDELITWRELGFNFCSHRTDYDRYESLPEWAQATLAEHASDPRPFVYTGEQLENAQTHDPLWNAAQNQLVREGRIHNYLRMLWGKKVLEWSPSPRVALEHLIHLNNKYAIDGRNPNSYSGIFWVLGRYDRPWGPERPIYGKIRYMTSENTARKVSVKNYIKKYDGQIGFNGSTAKSQAKLW